MRARHIPANQASPLRLLKAVSAPAPGLDEIEELTKHDASLCYRLLRYLKSALLSERELVRWIRMATALITGQEKCSELVPSSLVRAHQMTAAGTRENQSCLFAKATTNLGIRDRLAIACVAR